MEFSEVKSAAKLENATEILTEKVTSRTQCVSFCVIYSSCKSYNFCGHTWCHLYSDDIHSNFAYFANSTDCVYGGMPRAAVPRCEEKGQVKLVTDDEFPGLCSINEKRQDCSCEPDWLTSELVLNSTHWITKKSKLCTPGSHVYEINCAVERHEHLLLFPDERETFWGAVDFCKNHGAQLYGAIDGSQEQVERLFLIFTRQFWLEVNDVGHEMVWKNARGETLNAELSSVTTENFDPSETRHMLKGYLDDDTGLYLLRDTMFDKTMPFACETIFSELSKWTWEEVLIDTRDQLTIYETRDCFNSSLYSPGCVGHVKRNTTYHWVFSPKSWDEAKLHCETEFDAVLFFGLDGSQEQILFLAQHMEFTSFWVGISDEENEGSFVNLNGQDMHYIGTGLIRFEGVSTGDDTLNWLAFWDTHRLTVEDDTHVIREVAQSEHLNFVCWKTVLY